MAYHSENLIFRIREIHKFRNYQRRKANKEKVLGTHAHTMGNESSKGSKSFGKSSGQTLGSRQPAGKPNSPPEIYQVVFTEKTLGLTLLQNPANQAEVKDLVPGSTAALSGQIAVGDIVTKVNDVDIETYDMFFFIVPTADRPLTISFSRTSAQRATSRLVTSQQSSSTSSRQQKQQPPAAVQPKKFRDPEPG